MLLTAGIEAFASGYIIHHVVRVYYRDIDFAIVVHIYHRDVHVRSKGIVILIDREIVLIIAINDDTLRDISVDLLLTHNSAIESK